MKTTKSPCTNHLESTLLWRSLLALIRAVMVICSVMAVGCIIYSVILRYILKANFYGSEEVILLFAFWLYFTGAMHGSYENSHIKADILNALIKNLRIKDAVGLTAQSFNVVVNGILVVWSIKLLLWSMEKMPLSTALKIPLVIPQSAICVGMTVMLFYHVFYLQKNARLFFRNGYFSIPGTNEYITVQIKENYPHADAPVRSEHPKKRSVKKEVR